MSSYPDTPLSKTPTRIPEELDGQNGIQLAPIEPHTSCGPTLLTQANSGRQVSVYHETYWFKRLKREMPLPGRLLSAGMLATLFLVMTLAGWNDASQGPLLPSLQKYYNVDYLVISIIWICNFVGFMTSGLTNVYITDHIGFGLAAPLGAAMQALAYVLILWSPPYPLFLISYIFNGFGLGLQDAQVNSLTSRLPNANTKMFLMHAFYGFGATISPLIATEFVKKVPNRVHLYFAVSLGLAAFTVAMLFLTFRMRTEDQVVGRRPSEPESPVADNNEVAVGTEEKKKRAIRGSGNKMKKILSTPTVHYLAFYIAIYVGVEVTIGGWVTTFLIDERGGNDNAGYVTTGYFGGIALGRVALIPVCTWLGKHNSIYIFSILTIALEIAIWTVNDLVANAVCYSLIGVLLGPMYPIVMMAVLDVMPSELQGGSIGWIASLGQAGSAMMPFITGGISNKYGVWILQPLIVAFVGFSLILWFLVPRPPGIWV